MRHHRIATVAMVSNPAAGRGGAERAANLATARLRHRGVAVTEVSGTTAEDTAARLSRTLDHDPAGAPDAVVVVGGDGMVSLALQVLAGGSVPFGIVPAGTGNDHARQFGLPTTDPHAAADIVADGWAQPIDLGRIRRDDGGVVWFGTVMAAGFDSLVSDRANRMRWPRGRMRYNLALLAELSRLRLLEFRVSFDGCDEQRMDLALMALGNTRSYGGGMLICPNADPTDGLLDITMVTSASRSRLVRLFPRVFRGTHVDLDEVRTVRARTVRVGCPGASGLNAYADGDCAGPLPVEVSAVPSAVSILRSRPAAGDQPTS